ncbi:MAG: hypothetical protein QOF82_2930 [Frankiales bacterium]|nr:hypothetical protein [Frankiales bacterium]
MTAIVTDWAAQGAWICPTTMSPRPPDHDAKWAMTLTDSDTLRHVRCVFCAKPIPAASFAYTSAAKLRVLSGCPSCGRQVTLPTATWLRWSK